ncbi:hypothetical protein BDA96_04G076800 [Sorghum bicolor]|uniref:Uncharacterized protein n=1 Tax=Sorghum bicolor TaxID=4558 RepID=A0A921UHC5_SORBI|nr:hypothetical protein BDA96_04G076800 [Sorghum bicolor]
MSTQQSSISSDVSFSSELAVQCFSSSKCSTTSAVLQ